MTSPLRPSRGPIQLPKPPLNACKDAVVIQAYLTNTVRALEQQLNALFQLNNSNTTIDPDPSYSTSIAGNTASTSKVRDFVLTAINSLKNNNKLN